MGSTPEFSDLDTRTNDGKTASTLAQERGHKKTATEIELAEKLMETSEEV